MTKYSYRFMAIHLLSLVRQTTWLSLFLLFLAVAPAQAQQLRVAVAQKVAQINIGTSTTAIVSDGSGHKLGELQPQKGLIAEASNEEIKVGNTQVAELWVKPQKGGYIWIGDRWYRGTVRIMPEGKRLLAVNHVDLEQYLYSVLGAEMSTTFPAEALKAQAVAARTYALYRSQSAQKKLFDVDATQSSQVYRGLSSEANTTQSAVNATLGQVMTYQGKPILAAFHSASGGHTENVEDIWTDKVPYLRGVTDYDLDTPGNEWNRVISLSELSKSLKVGNVKSIAIDKTTQFGSVLSLKVSGDTQESVPGNSVRTALKLRSLRFTVTPTPEGFLFKGRGYGHGLGMSQWGAYKLAERGMKYSSILSHYYQGVDLGKLGK